MKFHLLPFAPSEAFNKLKTMDSWTPPTDDETPPTRQDILVGAMELMLKVAKNPLLLGGGFASPSTYFSFVIKQTQKRLDDNGL